MHYQFVDCRFELGNPDRGHELYLEGHIPGASFLNVDIDLSDLSVPDAGRHPLPSADRFAGAAGRAGIASGTLVVAYDQGMTGGAARLWWLLRHFGHDDVAVLKGGLASWAGPLRGGAEQIERVRFEPRPRTGDTIDAAELLQRLDDPRLVILDARSVERHRGDPGPDPAGGRIPGSRNLPFPEAFPPPRHLLAAEEIAVYCGSGVTACVDLLALADAGRPDARLYPGSWSEWSGRELPSERD